MESARTAGSAGNANPRPCLTPRCHIVAIVYLVSVSVHDGCYPLGTVGADDESASNPN